MSIEIPDTLVQKRLVDGLEYHFHRSGTHDGRPSYTRTDGMVLCRWRAGSGWVACSTDGVENGWPAFTADTPLPPEWPWWSHKGEKSYTYSLALAPERYADLVRHTRELLTEAADGRTRGELDSRMPEWIRDRVATELGLA